MHLDHLENGFDLLILITSNWWDPRGRQPLNRQVWAEKVKVRNTNTTSKQSQLVFKKLSTAHEPFAALLPGVGPLLVLLLVLLLFLLSAVWVSLLLLRPNGPNFAQNWHFWPNIVFFAHLIPCPTKKQCEQGAYMVLPLCDNKSSATSGTN